MKRILTAAGLAVACLALAACGGSAPEATSGADASAPDFEVSGDDTHGLWPTGVLLRPGQEVRPGVGLSDEGAGELYADDVTPQEFAYVLYSAVRVRPLEFQRSAANNCSTKLNTFVAQVRSNYENAPQDKVSVDTAEEGVRLYCAALLDTPLN